MWFRPIAAMATCCIIAKNYRPELLLAKDLSRAKVRAPQMMRKSTLSLLAPRSNPTTSMTSPPCQLLQEPKSPSLSTRRRPRKVVEKVVGGKGAERRRRNPKKKRKRRRRPPPPRRQRQIITRKTKKLIIAAPIHHPHWIRLVRMYLTKTPLMVLVRTMST